MEQDSSQTTIMLLCIATAVLMAGTVTLLVVWARYRWRGLKPKLFPDDSTNSGGAADLVSGFRSWPRQLPAILGSTQEHALGALPQDHAILSTARKAITGWSDCGAAAESVALESLDLSDVRSSLVELDGHYVYLVAVPNRHEHPNLLQKYSYFATGWCAHFRALRDC